MTMQTWSSYNGLRPAPNLLSNTMNFNPADSVPMNFNMEALQQLPSFSTNSNGGGSWWDSLFDKTDTKTGMKTQGMAMPLINGASALMSGILGYKQYGLQKDALKQTKKEFDLNWGAQQKTVNSQLEDRQRARVASNPNAYQSVGDYMKKNGI